MNEYTKIELANKGKTKEIWKTDVAGEVIVKNLPIINANSGTEETKQFEAKAKYTTTTSAHVFELLEKAGIPTVYIAQLSETEIVAKNCEMILLEVIARRYAMDSFSQRYPELKKAEAEIPHRFHSLCFELFLKTNNGGLTIDEETLISGSILEQDNPFIANPYDSNWTLWHSKSMNTTLLGCVDSRKILPVNIEMKQIEELTRQSFLVLEGAWNNLGYRLIDLKLEFGITDDGKLVIADIINNDSWHIRTGDWKEVSQKVFREVHSQTEIEDKDMLVSQLVTQFRIPEQTIVLWRGSESDKLPEIPDLAGLRIETPVISGHKKTVLVTKELEKLHTLYPEGGVIIALVGMSNGLGPILSARTNWPVISVCTTAGEFPQDVWSALRMPSNVPNATMLDSKNAILCALNILGHKNPAIYSYRRLAIESLDE